MSTETNDKGRKPYSEQCFIKDFMSFFSVVHGKDYSDYDSGTPRHNSLESEPRNVLKVDRLHLNRDFQLDEENQANECSITFMSKLSSPHAQNMIENVPKELMSNLQPKIEIFKIYYNSEMCASLCV